MIMVSSISFSLPLRSAKSHRRGAGSALPSSVFVWTVLLALAVFPTGSDAFASNFVQTRSGCMTELDTTEIIMNNKVVPASESDFPKMQLVIVRAKEQRNIIEIDYKQSLPYAVWIKLQNPYDELRNIQYVLETKSTNALNKASFAEIGGCDDNRRAAGKTGADDIGIFYRIEEWPEPQGEFHVWGGWAGGHERVRLTEPLIFRRPEHMERPQQHEEKHQEAAVAAEHREVAAVVEEHHEEHHAEDKHLEHSEEHHAVEEHHAEAEHKVEEHHAEADHHVEEHHAEADHHVEEHHAEAEHHVEEHHTEAERHVEEHHEEAVHHGEEHHAEEHKAEEHHVEEHKMEEHHADAENHLETEHHADAENHLEAEHHAEAQRQLEEHHNEHYDEAAAADHHHEEHVDEHHHDENEEEEEAEAAEELEKEEELGDDTKKQEELAHDKKAFDHERLKELGQRLAAFRDGNWHGLPHDLKRKWSPEEFRRMREERNFGHPKREYEERKEPLHLNDRKAHEPKDNIKQILDRFKDARFAAGNKFDLFAHRQKLLHNNNNNEHEDPKAAPSGSQSWQERYESESFGHGGPLDLQQFAYGAIFFVVSNLVLMQLCLMTGKREKGRRDM